MKDKKNKKDEKWVSCSGFEEYCIKSERAEMGKFMRFIDDAEPFILIGYIILGLLAWVLY